VPRGAFKRKKKRREEDAIKNKNIKQKATKQEASIA
jgi:hypothetical protein